MKNILLVAITTLFLSVSAFSQNPLPVGNSQLNLGVGLSEWGVPFYIGFDYGAHKDITVGLELSYRSYRENWRKEYYDHTILGFSGNANYHFNNVLNINPKWDLYAGINLGFYSWRSDKYYNGNYRSGLGLAAQLGGRYYLSNKVGLNLEFGGGNAFSGGKFGLTFKL